jgi:hypothetical protein
MAPTDSAVEPKFLDPHPFNEGNAAGERFVREAEFLFRLRHRSIIPIFGVGDYEGAPYILGSSDNRVDEFNAP